MSEVFRSPQSVCNTGTTRGPPGPGPASPSALIVSCNARSLRKAHARMHARSLRAACRRPRRAGRGDGRSRRCSGRRSGRGSGVHTRRLDELQLEREQPRLEHVLLLEQSSHLRREGRLVQRLVIVRRVRLAWLLARRARTCDARTCGGAFARRCLGRQAGWGRETTTKRFFSGVRRGEHLHARRETTKKRQHSRLRAFARVTHGRPWRSAGGRLGAEGATEACGA
jgi:hypothetical protein